MRARCYLGGVAAEITTAVLLAAGRGKRLGDLTARTPKPLLDIAGSPLVSHIIDALVGAGLAHFIVVTGYLSEQIEGWAKIYQRENPGIKITTVRQPELNGTGGAMLAVKAHLAGHERFVFGWGDILMDRANYPRFIHHARNDDYDLMLAVNRVKDPFRGAAVYVDAHMIVERLDEKPAPGTAKTEWNNAGVIRHQPDNFRLHRAARTFGARRARNPGRNCANDRRRPRRARCRHARILERRRHTRRP